MLKLTNYLQKESVALFDLPDKKSALTAMIDVITANNDLTARKADITSAIFEREAIMSTGIGRGIAVPHVRSDAVSTVRMAFGIFKKPIDYTSMDDKPVHIIVMLVVPKALHQEYLRILARIVLLLKNDNLKQQLLDCSAAGDAYNILSAY
ncbi:MAG: PTS sugar transporter subunit IIA [Candidatus Auribacter fodinae]|jgi:PTS system nitrogen regulatory IIA component|uniref:PTS sugar transporter subunit IIA n=1 Tax=Candidatus Auribacter fodinae TaxID=2093366 RepID=A0A3A4QTA4_9BACT|nr:MAG: PTS sugar transporter subunit IIA [Candidatus Auribacter fodinae]